MNINKLRKQDYVSTDIGNGYIEKILKQENKVIISLDNLRTLDMSKCRIEAKMIKKIIKRAYHYEVDYYYDDKDEITYKEFDTLAKARKFFNSKKNNKRYAYLRITKRSSEYDLLEVINENY